MRASPVARADELDSACAMRATVKREEDDVVGVEGPLADAATEEITGGGHTTGEHGSSEEKTKRDREME
jgi:hypothetical protein